MTVTCNFFSFFFFLFGLYNEVYMIFTQGSILKLLMHSVYEVVQVNMFTLIRTSGPHYTKASPWTHHLVELAPALGLHWPASHALVAGLLSGICSSRESPTITVIIKTSHSLWTHSQLWRTLTSWPATFQASCRTRFHRCLRTDQFKLPKEGSEVDPARTEDPKGLRAWKDTVTSELTDL